uniref:Uncharacterized protein n=1 Tax=viral metagenome TaxID=1070528 RepID=A0A6H1ZQB5_9ZZZZ
MCRLDWLYLLGVGIVWIGNSHQIFKVFSTKSVDSFSLLWLGALAIGFGLRIPRAYTAKEEYPIWIACYVFSTILLLVLLGAVVYYKIGG